MKIVQTTIEINAKPEKVFKVLMDFESYPKWNPFIKRITGKPNVGETLTITIDNGKMNPQIFQPTVLKNEKNAEFRWAGKFGAEWMFRGEHYFTLHEINNGRGTKLVHGEVFTGALGGPVNMYLGASTEESFKRMNQALKKKVES